ncbi:hypothetical protein EJ065_5552 [Corallococcus coralloides]|uniref:Uncharacterized protein n=1 Tax=Corallococcus coralloides TaxID=184914 RepID=A0A410RYS1_CORCK|nr:hypothetical protein EJ065_5552 [Corallococcus coralloides]
MPPDDKGNPTVNLHGEKRAKIQLKNWRGK